MMNQDQIDHFLTTRISLAALELLLIEVPQKEVFRSAIGERRSRQALIIKWLDEDGAIGFGECSCRPDPFYSHEFVRGAVTVVKDFIFPYLDKTSDYKSVLTKMHHVRGWNFTKAAIEFAMNDAIRRKTNKGILEYAGWQPIKQVPVGVSLGIFNSVDAFNKRLNEILPANYQRLKFKINPGYNQDVLASMAALQHNNISFDANGSFNLEAFHLLAKFAALNHIIEQPLPPGDMYLYAQYLKDYHPFKICLDEDIESLGNLVPLLPQIDEVNIKPGRVGGLFNTLQLIEYCNHHGLPAWIGGMFETGIGRAQNLQIAALLPHAKAHDLSPSSRYFTRDVLTNPIQMDQGYISQDQFMEVEIDEEVLESMIIDKIVLKK